MFRTECLGGVNAPRINRGIFSQQKWKLTVDPLCWSLIYPPQDQQRQSPFHVKVDFWSSPCQSLICPQNQQCWSPLHWSSITSMSSIDPPPGSTMSIASMPSINHLYVNCWSTPRINSVDRPHVDSQSSLCQSLIRPQINSIDHLCVDWSTPLQISTF